jgi:hypothetical protein
MKHYHKHSMDEPGRERRWCPRRLRCRAGAASGGRGSSAERERRMHGNWRAPSVGGCTKVRTWAQSRPPAGGESSSPWSRESCREGASARRRVPPARRPPPSAPSSASTWSTTSQCASLCQRAADCLPACCPPPARRCPGVPSSSCTTCYWVLVQMTKFYWLRNPELPKDLFISVVVMVNRSSETYPHRPNAGITLLNKR